MFHIFNIPRVNYNYCRPTIYRRRYNPIESYLLNSIREAQEIEKLRAILYNRLIQQQYKDQLSVKSEISNKQKSKDIVKCNNTENNNNNNDNNVDINANDNPVNESPSPFYYFESHSIFDGEKFIEERKERTIDSEGKIHQSLKRRIDDQWYETEQTEDENGQAVNKETWHNVSEDGIEQFKQDWISNSSQKLGLTENDKKEEEKEQKQTETEKKENFENGKISREEEKEECMQNEERKEEIKDENQTNDNEKLSLQQNLNDNEMQNE